MGLRFPIRLRSWEYRLFHAIVCTGPPPTPFHAIGSTGRCLRHWVYRLKSTHLRVPVSAPAVVSTGPPPALCPAVLCGVFCDESGSVMWGCDFLSVYAVGNTAYVTQLGIPVWVQAVGSAGFYPLN